MPTIKGSKKPKTSFGRANSNTTRLQRGICSNTRANVQQPQWLWPQEAHADQSFSLLRTWQMRVDKCWHDKFRQHSIPEVDVGAAIDLNFSRLPRVSTILTKQCDEMWLLCETFASLWALNSNYDEAVASNKNTILARLNKAVWWLLVLRRLKCQFKHELKCWQTL